MNKKFLCPPPVFFFLAIRFLFFFDNNDDNDDNDDNDNSNKMNGPEKKEPISLSACLPVLYLFFSSPPSHFPDLTSFFFPHFQAQVPHISPLLIPSFLNQPQLTSIHTLPLPTLTPVPFCNGGSSLTHLPLNMHTH